MAYSKTFVPLIKQPAQNRTCSICLNCFRLACPVLDRLSTIFTVNKTVHCSTVIMIISCWNSLKKITRSLVLNRCLVEFMYLIQRLVLCINLVSILVILFMTKRFNILPNTSNLEEILPFYNIYTKLQ